MVGCLKKCDSDNQSAFLKSLFIFNRKHLEPQHTKVFCLPIRNNWKKTKKKKALRIRGKHAGISVGTALGICRNGRVRTCAVFKACAAILVGTLTCFSLVLIMGNVTHPHWRLKVMFMCKSLSLCFFLPHFVALYGALRLPGPFWQNHWTLQR